MKPGILHIVFFFLMLLFFGCVEQNTSPPPETLIPENTSENPIKDSHENTYKKQNQQLESRFKLDQEENQYGIRLNEKETKDNYQYYIPVEQLEKQSFIPVDGIRDLNRKAEEYFDRKPGNPREQDFFKDGRTSPEIFFTAIFDNDIFNYTDYYYTNGIDLEFYHPLIRTSPFSLILPGLKNSINYYSLSLVQNLYTPQLLEYTEVLVGDRPFASYLTLGHQRVSLDPVRQARLQTEFVFGVIGPASLGGEAQDAIHSHKPVGWINQVKNDVVLNYNLKFEQGVYRGKGVEFAIFAGGQAGTLYDNVTTGLYLELGKANDRYGSVFQTTGYEKSFKRRIRYFLGIDAANKLVIYDATLQGGMFNRESVYKLDDSQICRYVFTGKARIGIGLGRYSIEAEQVFLTPEFKGGTYHLWFRIKNIICID